MKRVAIVGGGMAGLTAAWHLSGPRSRGEIEVTVYQRGWRLGGKGASSRGVGGRIEEHGLHVWLGFYENAFRLMRKVYAELDRFHSDPSCPIQGFSQAFSPIGRVGLADGSHAEWSDWVATFSDEGGGPGEHSDEPAMSPLAFIRRALSLLVDFADSLPDPTGVAVTSPVVLSGSPERPAKRQAVDRLIRRAEIAGLIGALEALRVARTADLSPVSPEGVILARLGRLQDDITGRLGESPDSRRAADLADLVICGTRGMIVDGLLSHPEGLAAINHLDFREWLRSHGAQERTCNSALVKGLHDLTFAYQDGDFTRPRFAAGVGLMLSRKMFFEYRGALFWRMEAGMGDIVFAPLYQALRARGVRFEFFHRLDQLHLSADATTIDAVTFGLQAEMREPGEYRPLMRFGDLPCFPTAPDAAQLVCNAGVDSEYHWADRSAEKVRKLLRGRDFDDVILAVSIGMVPHTCGEMLADSARWRSMVANVSTIPTQALQLWMRPTDSELGWPHGGSVISGFPSPFDTYASMSHLIPREAWRDEHRPGAIAYFCSALADDGRDDPEIAHKIVKSNAVDLINNRLTHFWPAARQPNGDFRWELLHMTDEEALGDPLDSQYWRANVDPSDRYVLCLPGSLVHRLRADRSGYANLFLAGDWIDNGHNGGCIEAAVISGMQAANAVRGRPLSRGVLGGYRPAP